MKFRALLLPLLVGSLIAFTAHCGGTSSTTATGGDTEDETDTGTDSEETSITATDGLGNTIDVTNWGDCIMDNLTGSETAAVESEFVDGTPPDLTVIYSGDGLIASIDGETCDFSSSEGPEFTSAEMSTTCHTDFTCGDYSCRYYADSDNGTWNLSTFSKYTNDGQIVWAFGEAKIYEGLVGDGGGLGSCDACLAASPSSCCGSGCICESQCTPVCGNL